MLLLGSHSPGGLKVSDRQDANRITHLSLLIQPIRPFLPSQQSGSHKGRPSSQVLLYMAAMATARGRGPHETCSTTSLLCLVKLHNRTFADMSIEIQIGTVWADCQLTVMVEGQRYYREAAREKCGKRASKQVHKSDQWATEGK